MRFLFATMLAVAALATPALADDGAAIPQDWQGHWCRGDRGDGSDFFKRGSCTDDPLAITVTDNGIEERDSSCRLVAGRITEQTDHHAMFRADLICRSKKGDGHAGTFNATDQLTIGDDGGLLVEYPPAAH